MRTHCLRISIACFIAFASLANAQSPARSCTLRHPNPKLTPAQQKVAADGYRLACEAANALEERREQESHAAAQPDEAIPDTLFPVFDVDASAPLSDYKEWLGKYCPDLNKKVRQNLRGLSESDQLIYIESVYSSVRETHECS